MSIKIFLLYLAAWSLAALSPGPAVMCSMAQSTRYGFRSSLAGISGIQVGSTVFFVCIALGLGTLLATATTAFTVLRLLGAIYLFYLGVRIIISSFRRPTARVARPATSITTHQSLFLQGLLIQLTNPKALLFVTALLPQFIDPHCSVPLQLVILLLATIAVDTVIAIILRLLCAERHSVVSGVTILIFGSNGCLALRWYFSAVDCYPLANDAA